MVIQPQAPHCTLAAVAVANIEAMVDEAVVLEDEDSDMDVDAVDDTSLTHRDAPIAVWTIIPLKNVERHPDLAATLPTPTNAAITAEKMDTSA